MTQRSRIYWFAAYGLAMSVAGSVGAGVFAGVIVAFGAILLDIYAPK